MQDFVERELIFMTLAGSHLYGMNTPESDIDRRGVCVPPKNVVMGFARKFEQQDYSGEDTTVYSLTKFMDLASRCNPNIIELLFAPEICLQTVTPTWKELIKYRDKFLSAEAYHTFCGYAHSQLQKMKSHRGWLFNPPTHKPTRQEYGLVETGLGVRELVKGIDITTIDPMAVDIINREKQYKTALATWHQYEDWKKNRNIKRGALEAKCGYDTKNASHLIRLLRMAEEILSKGTLTVHRPDAAELLTIKRGGWIYEDLIKEADALKARITQIYEEEHYVVPRRTDKNFLSDLCVELHEFHWKKGLS